MKHDPFYQQIFDGLGRALDPEAFERCATDLLRSDLPALVPIPGGDDAGMDGTIADGEGVAFPLVCTTSKDVIGNLTRSLNSYLADGGTRRKVVVATSQHLSQRRRKNLEDRAAEMGFTLIQIYGQVAFADRLYRNPEWCRALLGLSGNPSALSIIPLTQRPLTSLPLIGREPDLASLRQTPGDRLVVGLPGCGKTALLLAYAKQEEGLFVVSDDRGAIAAALRAQRPKRIIVDDAHVKLALLTSLYQLRQELGASFEVIAACWPGQSDPVMAALQISSEAVHQVGLLTRDEMVEIVAAAGIRRPNLLVREIVNQADGRPGLAVTLTSLCLRGGLREVALGDALSRSVRTTFEGMIGRQATMVLGVLSLGGNRGMPTDAVADLLGLSRGEILRMVTDLAAGGVITPIGSSNHLVVRPAGLRQSLVRDLFFEGVVTLPLARALGYVPDLSEAVSTLIGGRGRGGNVPRPLLESLLEQVGSANLWDNYAALGAPEATYVLDHHPELAVHVAQTALRWVPEQVIPLLLQAAVGDDRSSRQSPEHPLRPIEDWVMEARPGTGAALPRRRCLVRCIGQWRRAGGGQDVTGRALACALSIRFRATSLDPGSGMTVTMAQAMLTAAEIDQLRDLWSEVVMMLQNGHQPVAVDLLTPLEDLVYPGRCDPRGAPDDVAEAASSLARVAVVELAALAARQPGILHRLWSLALELGVSLDQEIEDDFAVLFPIERAGSVEEEEQQATVARAFATAWIDRNPESVAERLDFLEREAAAAKIRWPRLTPQLGQALAGKVSSPGTWARALIDRQLAPDLIFSFLNQSVARQEEGWEELVASCLQQQWLQALAVPIILSLPEPPRRLLEATLPLLPEISNVVEHLCLRGEITDTLLPILLTHDAPAVAAATAMGLWLRHRGGDIPNVLQPRWRQAILHARADESFLDEILRSDPTLTAEWLRTYLTSGREQPLRINEGVRAAIRVLPEPVRAELLDDVPEDWFAEELVNDLMSGSLEVYRSLLQMEHRQLYHLKPLAQTNQAHWSDMIMMALDQGYSIQDVASGALQPLTWTWSGNQSEMWQQRLEQFTCLLSHADARVRQVGGAVKELAVSARDNALAQERDWSIHGRL